MSPESKSNDLGSCISNIVGLPSWRFQRSSLVYCKSFIIIFWLLSVLAYQFLYLLNRIFNLLREVESSSLEVWESPSARLSCHFPINSESFAYFPFSCHQGSSLSKSLSISLHRSNFSYL